MTAVDDYNSAYADIDDGDPKTPALRTLAIAAMIEVMAGYGVVELEINDFEPEFPMVIAYRYNADRTVDDWVEDPRDCGALEQAVHESITANTFVELLPLSLLTVRASAGRPEASGRVTRAELEASLLAEQ